MYLLVFVTLVISLIGIYAQVISVQAARLASNQTAVIQQMLRWHSTAISQTRYAAISPIPGVAGCDLTTGGLAGIPCDSPARGQVWISETVPPAWTAFECAGTLAPPCWTALPPGYQADPYTFYSIFYQPTTAQNYVITFIPPPVTNANNPPPGFISLPESGAAGAQQVGATMGDIVEQVRNVSLPAVSYGTIAHVGGTCGTYCLVTPSFYTGTGSTTFQYPLPTALDNAAYNGTFAIISSP
jgi:hypothetical protein